ncbi:MAG: hypothetical protein AAFZ58_04885 [Pseudomonadota bacterium]
MQRTKAAVSPLIAIAMGLVVPAITLAQDEPTDDLEPAVSGAELEASGSTDDVEPAVSGPALGAGVTRRASADGVIDQLDLGSTTITGNQELPKVLYILPWKQADLGDLVGRPVNSLLDEVLEPIDRDVFQRQSAYYESLYGTEPTEITE